MPVVAPGEKTMAKDFACDERGAAVGDSYENESKGG